MTQICPSPSHQLVAAALAFRRARRKFPKNLGVCACSEDTAGTTFQVYSVIARDAIPAITSRVTDPKPDYTTKLSPNAQGKSKTSTDMCRRICGRIKPVDSRESNQSHAETVSKSTYSSVGPKKRKHVRHRRPCNNSGRIKKYGSRSPPEIHICGYCDYNRKISAVENLRLREEKEKVYCSDSPTVADFPTKLHTWERRTLQGSLATGDRGAARRGAKTSCPETFPKDQMPNSSRNQEAICKLHPSFSKKPLKLNSNEDFCLRPSLIKAAQQKIDIEDRKGGKNCQKCGIGHRRSKHLKMKSNWDENLNVINHKDSMSILMKRFRGNEKQQSLKLQNIYELNSVLERKTSRCREGEGLRSEKIKTVINQPLLQPFEDIESVEAHFPPSKSSSGIDPVAKLGRVTNQALRESESCFKNIRSRLNRSGICCSQMGTHWRKTF